jgi:DNA polymerase V
MFALVDVNSFYASCEKVFRPDLEGKPIVVVSNNDGCIISLSREAKQFGIKMGEPYFKFKEKLYPARFTSLARTMRCMPISAVG